MSSVRPDLRLVRLEGGRAACPPPPAAPSRPPRTVVHGAGPDRLRPVAEIAPRRPRHRAALDVPPLPRPLSPGRRRASDPRPAHRAAGGPIRPEPSIRRTEEAHDGSGTTERAQGANRAARRLGEVRRGEARPARRRCRSPPRRAETGPLVPAHPAHSRVQVAARDHLALPEKCVRRKGHRRVRPDATRRRFTAATQPPPPCRAPGTVK